MPSHSPSLGACAKVHGQGMVQLQTSNQSPSRCQSGTSATVPPSLESALSGILAPWGPLVLARSSYSTALLSSRQGRGGAEPPPLAEWNRVRRLHDRRVRPPRQAPDGDELAARARESPP